MRFTTAFVHRCITNIKSKSARVRTRAWVPSAALHVLTSLMYQHPHACLDEGQSRVMSMFFDNPVKFNLTFETFNKINFLTWLDICGIKQFELLKAQRIFISNNLHNCTDILPLISICLWKAISISLLVDFNITGRFHKGQLEYSTNYMQEEKTC